MANNKAPHEIADTLHKLENLVLIDKELKEEVTPEGDVETIVEAILLLVVPGIDRIHDGVHELFTEEQDRADILKGHPEFNSRNALHTTATESELAVPGKEKSLIENILGKPLLRGDFKVGRLSFGRHESDAAMG